MDRMPGDEVRVPLIALVETSYRLRSPKIAERLLASLAATHAIQEQAPAMAVE
jgi:hypothetical protein